MKLMPLSQTPGILNPIVTPAEFWIYPLKAGQIKVKPFVVSLSNHERLNRPPCHKEVNPQYVTYFQVITPHEIFLF